MACLRVQFATRESTRTLSGVEVDARTQYLSGKTRLTLIILAWTILQIRIRV